MLKYTNTKIVELNDWDNLIKATYQRPYSFQQQGGCKERGHYKISIPSEPDEEYTNDSIPEIVNGEEMGVSFVAWLARDPEQHIPNQTQDYELRLFWHRNFYPDVQTVANDLHNKGLIEAGDYIINIDW